ncbi:hypothetical protein [Aeromonas caviae]|uniref:hypothetical protein n=1 Tax=Aeromonas caviae TaxID=648 RepID=UPI001432CA3C|nr:hypothetical protein [Aeromonas caviae]NKD14523.1 hypothetical protein [Aeromonas caviae]
MQKLAPDHIDKIKITFISLAVARTSRHMAQCYDVKYTTQHGSLNMNDIKLIDINELNLDLENPRFTEPAVGQRDAINKMLEIQGPRLIQIAKDIAENGIDPSENLIIFTSEDDDNHYIVAEGNRRLSALKLIQNPLLAENKRHQESFQKIKLSMVRSIDSVNCVVFDDDSYERWVLLKHTGQNSGVGRVEWTTPEKERHASKHGKTSFQYQVYQYMEKQTLLYKDILRQKRHIKMTNLGRLFGDPAVRKRMDIESIDGTLFCWVPEGIFLEKLGKILRVMTSIGPNGRADFTVNHIRSKENRNDFMDDLGIKTLEEEKLAKPWKIIDGFKFPDGSDAQDANGSGQEGTSSATGSSSTDPNDQDGVNGTNDANGSSEPKPTGGAKNPPKPYRDNLIPSSVKLTFGSHKKCHRIFSELKGSLNFKEHTNSISVMLRIFIDLSVTHYVEMHDLKKEQNNGKPPKVGLHDKIVLSAEHLRKSKKITGPECTAIQAFSSAVTNSAGSLHQYVHNGNLYPSKDILNTEWDNFQPLMIAIWS